MFEVVCLRLDWTFFKIPRTLPHPCRGPIPSADFLDTRFSSLTSAHLPRRMFVFLQIFAATSIGAERKVGFSKEVMFRLCWCSLCRLVGSTGLPVLSEHPVKTGPTFRGAFANLPRYLSASLVPLLLALVGFALLVCNARLILHRFPELFHANCDSCQTKPPQSFREAFRLPQSARCTCSTMSLSLL